MKIESYYVDGEARDEVWIVNNRELLEGHMRDDMRSHGWAPSMDDPITISWDWVKDRDVFKFRMHAKGVRVGRKRALKSIGVVSGALVTEQDGAVLAAVA